MSSELSLSVSDREMCDRYQRIFTAAVNDILREMGYLNQALPYQIAPLRDDMRLCGVAFTIKGAKNLTLDGEMEKRADMLEALGPDCVAVWDTGGDDQSAQWGEIMTMAAVKRGCRGAVVDGGVRDTDRVLEQDFPVFCRYRTSNGMLGRFRMIDFQIPIQIGTVFIYPGDMVFGDMDGVVIIPRAVAYEVLIRAERVGIDEEDIKQQVDNGISPSEIVRNGGYF